MHPGHERPVARTLQACLPGRDLGDFVTQHDMFSHTGLTAAPVDGLRTQHAIYLPRSNCMCLVG